LPILLLHLLLHVLLHLLHVLLLLLHVLLLLLLLLLHVLLRVLLLLLPHLLLHVLHLLLLLHWFTVAELRRHHRENDQSCMRSHFLRRLFQLLFCNWSFHWHCHQMAYRKYRRGISGTASARRAGDLDSG